MKYLVIQPDGTYEQKETKKKELSLEQLQKLVGGYIELVHVKYKGRRYEAYVNEEGKLKNMPFNPKATALYHAAFGGSNLQELQDLNEPITELVKFMNISWDLIAGPMVITEVRD
jgi:hypothetical protein